MSATAGEALAWRIELVSRIESETSTSIAPPIRSDAPPEASSGVVHSGRGSSPEHAPPRRIYAEDEDRRGATRTDLTSGTETRFATRRSRLVATSAILLLLAGAAALSMRLVQLGSESVPAPELPERSTEAEPAIGLGGVARATLPTATVPPAPVPQATTSAKPAANADCENPFVIDAKGFRHPKPHCFKR